MSDHDEDRPLDDEELPSSLSEWIRFWWERRKVLGGRSRTSERWEQHSRRWVLQASDNMRGRADGLSDRYIEKLPVAAPRQIG